MFANSLLRWELASGGANMLSKHARNLHRTDETDAVSYTSTTKNRTPYRIGKVSAMMPSALEDLMNPTS